MPTSLSHRLSATLFPDGKNALTSRDFTAFLPIEIAHLHIARVRYASGRIWTVGADMKIPIAILLLIATLGRISGAEELKAAMPLHVAQRILEESGAKQDMYAYHFPWTSKFVEVKVLDGETWEQSEERTASELKKVTGKSGYSVFYTLNDKTRLELVLEVDGKAKVIHAIRLGETAIEYKDKFEWIAAEKEGKLRVITSLDPKR